MATKVLTTTTTASSSLCHRRNIRLAPAPLQLSLEVDDDDKGLLPSHQNERHQLQKEEPRPLFRCEGDAAVAVTRIQAMLAIQQCDRDPIAPAHLVRARLATRGLHAEAKSVGEMRGKMERCTAA